MARMENRDSDPGVFERFKRTWAQNFDAALPIAWFLRKEKVVPWARFYALPGGKRYPENLDQQSQVLNRANALGDFLFGLNEGCFLVEAFIDESACDEHCNSVDFAVFVTVGDVKWKSGTFDSMFLSIAEDERESLIWMSQMSGSILAPYDGGFDIFMRDPMRIKRVKSEFAKWASSHPKGL